MGHSKLSSFCVGFTKAKVIFMVEILSVQSLKNVLIEIAELEIWIGK
jgi:hypothetical protein